MFDDDELADGPETRLPFGVASLLAIAPADVWKTLIDHGETKQRLSVLSSRIAELAEIQERALMGIAEPGDTFRSLRLVTRVPASEFVRLIVELCRVDDDAMLPWQMVLKKRPKTKLQKSHEQIVKSVSRRQSQVQQEDQIVSRVIALRSSRNITLTEAFKVAATGHDVADEHMRAFFPARALSVATVKARYMRGIKRAKALDGVWTGGGLFGGKRKVTRLGKLTQKGRRPKGEKG